MLILRVVFAVEEFRRGLHERVSLATILPVVCPAFVIYGTKVHVVIMIPFQTPHEAKNKIRCEILIRPGLQPRTK